MTRTNGFGTVRDCTARSARRASGLGPQAFAPRRQSGALEHVERLGPCCPYRVQAGSPHAVDCGCNAGAPVVGEPVPQRCASRNRTY